jgi:AcrR family transcriptional regulator
MSRNPVQRKYNLGRRAEQQAETRQRIVEAAVELHGTLGPAKTSLSMIAERAGVQRHTLYAHFPDARSLAMACSGLAFERDPPPAHEPWLEIADTDKRLRTGLRAIYDWYDRNGDLNSAVLRDAEHHELTREIVQLRFGPVIGAYIDALGEPFNTKQRVMLGLALSFFTWRTLVRDIGLTQAAAVTAMTNAIENAG